jgi:hypothetical protein
MKRSKCVFGCSEVAYLGHVISTAKVSMDQQKVQAILDWSTSSFVRAVCSFLGLVGYYHRFIRDFGAITTPDQATSKGRFPRVSGGGTRLPHPPARAHHDVGISVA